MDNSPTECNGSQGAGGPLGYAVEYLQAGLSVIPIRDDGSKAPALSRWENFQKRAPSADKQARYWWQDGTKGIALVCSQVSGNREVIDIDDPELLDPWRELVESKMPGLVGRLPLVLSPGPGYALHYNCPVIEGNLKLARKLGIDSKTGKPKAETLIETRGEGGYILLPGSPSACHRTGRLYQHIGGPPITAAPTLTPEEREILLDAARAFDLMRPEGSFANGAETGPTGKRPGLSPGDDFNERGPDWAEILEGWQVVRESGGVRYWRRPGKDDPGWSATTGRCASAKGWELLAVFSTNAYPFEIPAGKTCGCYSKFAAYTFLRHGRDFKAAAKNLAAQRYGSRRQAGQGSGPPASPNTEGKSGYAIILEHFREKYRPVFRRGTSVYSEALGREVKATEACFGAGEALTEALSTASDAPTENGTVVRARLPGFFRNWASSAWTDMLDALPDEEASAEVSDPAQEEFQARLSSALHTMVSLGMVYGNASETRVERRSLINWCTLFGRKVTRWDDIRSHNIWVKRDGDRLRIALRVELFAQVGRSDAFKGLSPNKFGRLCEQYGVGTTKKEDGSPFKVNGQRAVELTPEFLAELMPVPDKAQPGAAGIPAVDERTLSGLAPAPTREETS